MNTGRTHMMSSTGALVFGGARTDALCGRLVPLRSATWNGPDVTCKTCRSSMESQGRRYTGGGRARSICDQEGHDWQRGQRPGEGLQCSVCGITEAEEAR